MTENCSEMKFVKVLKQAVASCSVALLLVASAALGQTNMAHKAEVLAPMPNHLYPGRNLVPLVHVSPEVRMRTEPVVNLQPLITPRPPASETTRTLVRVDVPFPVPAPLNPASGRAPIKVIPIRPTPVLVPQNQKLNR
jgi:hypothetical protein